MLLAPWTSTSAYPPGALDLRSTRSAAAVLGQEMGQATCGFMRAQGRIAVILGTSPAWGWPIPNPTRKSRCCPAPSRVCASSTDSTMPSRVVLGSARTTGESNNIRLGETSARSRAEFALTNRPPTNSSGSICSVPGANRLVVSSPLGTRSIRRHYNDAISAPAVARAFLAGNDLLYLTDLAPRQAGPVENVIDAIEFFAEQYEDPCFAPGR